MEGRTAILDEQVRALESKPEKTEAEKVCLYSAVQTVCVCVCVCVCVSISVCLSEKKDVIKKMNKRRAKLGYWINASASLKTPFNITSLSPLCFLAGEREAPHPAKDGSCI